MWKDDADGDSQLEGEELDDCDAETVCDKIAEKLSEDVTETVFVGDRDELIVCVNEPV